MGVDDLHPQSLCIACPLFASSITRWLATEISGGVLYRNLREGRPWAFVFTNPEHSDWQHPSKNESVKVARMTLQQST